MNLEEAIRHLEEELEIKEDWSCVACKEDHQQLLEWLKELQAIKNANPSEALKYVNGKIADLEDDLQHYTMVEKDKCKEFFIREDLKQFTNIKQALLNAQEDEKLKIDICEMFGLDNLFPYNDNKAILKQLEEYMDRKNQLWVDFMKASKQLKKQEKVLNVIKKHFIIELQENTEPNGNVWGRLVSIQAKEDEGTWDTTACANIADYKEDFDVLKEWLKNE